MESQKKKVLATQIVSLKQMLIQKTLENNFNYDEQLIEKLCEQKRLKWQSMQKKINIEDFLSDNDGESNQEDGYYEASDEPVPQLRESIQKLQKPKEEPTKQQKLTGKKVKTIKYNRKKIKESNQADLPYQAAVQNQPQPMVDAQQNEQKDMSPQIDWNEQQIRTIIAYYEQSGNKFRQLDHRIVDHCMNAQNSHKFKDFKAQRVLVRFLRDGLRELTFQIRKQINRQNAILHVLEKYSTALKAMHTKHKDAVENRVHIMLLKVSKRQLPKEVLLRYLEFMHVVLRQSKELEMKSLEKKFKMAPLEIQHMARTMLQTGKNNFRAIQMDLRKGNLQTVKVEAQKIFCKMVRFLQVKGEQLGQSSCAPFSREQISRICNFLTSKYIRTFSHSFNFRNFLLTLKLSLLESASMEAPDVQSCLEFYRENIQQVVEESKNVKISRKVEQDRSWNQKEVIRFAELYIANPGKPQLIQQIMQNQFNSAAGKFVEKKQFKRLKVLLKCGLSQLMEALKWKGLPLPVSLMPQKINQLADKVSYLPETHYPQKILLVKLFLRESATPTELVSISKFVENITYLGNSLAEGVMSAIKVQPLAIQEQSQEELMNSLEEQKQLQFDDLSSKVDKDIANQIFQQEEINAKAEKNARKPMNKPRKSKHKLIKLSSDQQIDPKSQKQHIFKSEACQK